LLFIYENIFVVGNLKHLEKGKVFIGSFENEIVERIQEKVLRNAQKRILLYQDPKMNSVWVKRVFHGSVWLIIVNDIVFCFALLFLESQLLLNLVSLASLNLLFLNIVGIS
jgi:hypothetical protein